MTPIAPTAIALTGDRQITLTRRFAAPPALLLRAHLEPDLIRRWMVGPDGWTMPLCQSDSRPGGSFRFDWWDGKATRFHATGEYIEVTPQRIVHVERMFLPGPSAGIPTPDNHVDTRFAPDGTGTLLTVTMTLATPEDRAAVLASGMTEGMEDSYARLETILTEGLTMPDTLPAATDSDLVYSRDFNASPALLWRAITDPAVLPLWLGGDTNPMIQCDSDLRPGGAFRWVWRHDGQPTGVTGRFLTVDAPRRLVNTELFDQDWTVGETTVTQTLTELAPQTTRLRMTIRYTSPAARDSAGPTMMAGLTAHYATLDRLLPTLTPGRSDFHLLATGDRQITVTRSFAAPLAAVHRAHTDAALLNRWMGSPDMPLEDCRMDARPQGGFRYVWRMRDGTRITLTGTITRLDPDRIAHTEIFDPDWTGGPTDVVTTFHETGGRTVVTVTITYSATPARDQVFASGMGEGMAGSYDLLDALLV